MLFAGMRSEAKVEQMKVAKIEYAGKESVFNMEVEDTHSFIVNGGIVSHNCYDETRYFLMSRPIAPLEKKKAAPRVYDPYGE